MALVLDGDNGIVGVLATNTDGDVIFDTDTLFVDAVENKVGIGTSSPSSLLTIHGSQPIITLSDPDTGSTSTISGNSGHLILNADSGSDASNNTIDFQIDNSQKMRINSSGNVGIGTDDPDNYYARDLVVNAADEGGITIVNDTSHQGYLMFADGTSGAETYRGYIGYDHAIDHLQITSGGIVKFLVNNNQEKMSITTSGVIQGASDAEIATSPIRTHSNTISTSTTIDANDNAVASGPLAIADGVTLTINGNMTVV